MASLVTTTPNTEPNSPGKTFQAWKLKQKLSQTKADDDFALTTKQSFNRKFSLTEKQIFSHKLIMEVMENSKRNTVHHNVNQIPKDTQLYKIPLQHDNKQFNFQAIPPSNLNYVSTASQKVKQIHQRLSDKRDLSERLNQLANKNIQLLTLSKYKKRKSASLIDTNKRVSISGLVSHKFNSVSARRSLGVIPDKPQQIQLLINTQQMKKRNNSSRDRQNRILKRKSNHQNLRRIQLSKAATCNFSLCTDSFLDSYIKQSSKNKLIYGEKMQKLDCIKQYINQQRADYGQAKFIVQQIVNAQPKKIKKEKQKVVKNIDDQLQLSKRKLASSRKKVMLKNLYFTQ